MTRLAIVQSSYIPWLGYFQLIKSADIFVLFDNVQFTNRDWRNRNRIKTAQGVTWLTIPVQKSKTNRMICETKSHGSDWPLLHLETIRRNYSRTRFFQEIFPKLTNMYERMQTIDNLSFINEYSIRYLCQLLDIDTKIVPARDKFENDVNANEKLLSICNKYGTKVYISGPKAKAYLDNSIFEKNGIKVEFIQYNEFVYDQMWGSFEPSLSVIDSLFNIGLTHTREMLN